MSFEFFLHEALMKNHILRSYIAVSANVQIFAAAVTAKIIIAVFANVSHVKKAKITLAIFRPSSKFIYVRHSHVVHVALV